MFAPLLVIRLWIIVKFKVQADRYRIYQQLSNGGRIMREMYFKPLSEEDRKKNQYLDNINHAPYFTIFFVIMAMIFLLTVGISIAAF